MSGMRQKTLGEQSSRPRWRRVGVKPWTPSPKMLRTVDGEASTPKARPWRNNSWRRYVIEKIRKSVEARSKQQEGSPGVDGMTIDAAKDYLREHWPNVRAQLLEGTYQPQPVKRVEIPKPDGGIRKLGVPCVVDRLIQQAMLQVLQERWDPTFRAQLRLSTGALRPSGSGSGATLCRRGLQRRGRSRSRKVL